MQASAQLFAVLSLIAAAGVSGHSLRKSGAGDVAPDADDGINALGITLELQNIDYFGLTDQWSDPNDFSDDVMLLANKGKSPLNIIGKNVTDALTDVEHWWDKNAKSGSQSNAATDKGTPASSESFLQGKVGSILAEYEGKKVDVCRSKSEGYFEELTKMSPPPTMMDAMRAGITNAVERAIDCERPSGSSAAFMSKVISVQPATIKGDKKVKATLHVTFRPGTGPPQLNGAVNMLAAKKGSAGPTMLNKPRASFLDLQSTRKAHWSTKADIIITDFPGNKQNDLKATKTLLKKALMNGNLHDSLVGSLFRVSGVMPDIRHLNVNSTIIKQWTAGDKVGACEKHLTKIVKAFTMHYTRAQVPMALYNECTNFMPKLSFSRDYILDHRDTHRCRKASADFEKIWKYGKQAAPKDFEKMCLSICEAKHGEGAPVCHVTEGDKLAKEKK